MLSLCILINLTIDTLTSHEIEFYTYLLNPMEYNCHNPPPKIGSVWEEVKEREGKERKGEGK